MSKRRRQDSPIRVQVSHPSAGPSTQWTQVNSHVHVGIDINDGPRTSFRTSHVSRPLEMVDLSSLLAEDRGEDAVLVDAEMDMLSAEETSNLAFGGVEDEEVEDPDGAEDEEEDGPRAKPVGKKFSLPEILI